METTIRRIAFQWDRLRSLLWACVQTTNGQEIRVGFPLAHVELTFCQEVEKEGVPVGPRVGAPPGTESFCGWVRSLSRRYDHEVFDPSRVPVLGGADLLRDDDEDEVGRIRLGRRIKRAFRRTAKRIGRAAKGMLRRVGKIGRTVVRALPLAAAAIPAIGGPALGALQAAKQARNTVRKARDVAQTAGRGLSSLSRGDIQGAIAQGRNVQLQVQRLSQQATPQANMLRSALRSLPF